MPAKTSFKKSLFLNMNFVSLKRNLQHVLRWQIELQDFSEVLDEVRLGRELAEQLVGEHRSLFRVGVHLYENGVGVVKIHI